MAGISIETFFNNKNFELLHVFMIHLVGEKGGKFEIEMTNIDQECYLSRRFSPQPLVRDGRFWHHSICLPKIYVLMYSITM